MNILNLKETEISNSSYNLIIGLTLFWGFLMNFLLVKFVDTSTLTNINPFVFYIGYFVSCIIGIFLAHGSDNPVISFIGYNFVVIPIGLVLNIALEGVYTAVIIKALLITMLFTIEMIVLSIKFPNFFRKLGRVLFISLLSVIIFEFLFVFIIGTSSVIIDVIVVSIFCLYIGYDWVKAQNSIKTVDSAIDNTVNIYLDIINLFLRLVSILNKND